MLVAFDLEGPISPQDNAYEVMKLIPNGNRIFELISKYDDILTLQGKKGYEPGDTLKLIIPFLVLHKIKEKDIKKVSEKAKITKNMKSVVSWIKRRKIKMCVISTSYMQHAYIIGRKIGVENSNIACTQLNLSKIKKEMENYEKNAKNADSLSAKIKGIEERIGKEKEEVVFKRLDEVYFDDGLFYGLNVEVTGGERKVNALKKFLKKWNESAADTIAIGDSITDYKMLDFIKREGGLSVAFNGNQYSIPYAGIGIASLDARAVIPVLKEFEKNGKEKTMELVRRLEKKKSGSAHYSVLENKNENELNNIVKIHKKFRMLARGEAGKLG